MSLSLIVGAGYLIFAEFWAIKGNGYYVYEFIDPRPKFALFLIRSDDSLLDFIIVGLLLYQRLRPVIQH